MSTDKPLPKIDPLNRPFWDAARAHRLVVQTCTGCGDAHFPPPPSAPPACRTRRNGGRPRAPAPWNPG